ncbi:MAG: hypothetical protein ACRCX4_04615 [Bacteroidales bacterium]
MNATNDYSQYENARSVSLSHATVSTYGFLNSASAVLYENSFVSATYENKYITKELSSTTIAGLYKSKFTDLAFCLNYFGYDIFNKTSISISAAKDLSEWFALGVRINYSSFYFHSESGRSNQLSADIGFLFFRNRIITAGINIGNLFRVRTDHNYDPLKLSEPVHIECGLSYKTLDDLNLLFQIAKTGKQDLKLALAAEYTGIHNFPVRVGVSGMPFSPSFGVGYKYNFLAIDIASGYHIDLGFSPTVTLSCSF